MVPPPKSVIARHENAFSLVEMAAVTAILATLMSAGIGLLNGTGSRSREAGTDLLTGLIEQARTAAITSRTHVVLAIAEPGDLPAGDGRCRIGLFKVDDWPEPAPTPLVLKGVLLKRWQTLDAGIALIGGDVDGVANPLDQPQVTITCGGGKYPDVQVHVIVFNSRGGLHYPPGSTPVSIRLAEGGYRGGKAAANRRGERKTITENRLKIGRVTARPYRSDG